MRRRSTAAARRCSRKSTRCSNRSRLTRASARTLATALLGASEILRLDSEGRIVLGERLRAALALTDEAAFVGHGHKFQIWEPSRFAAHLEEAKARVRRLRAELGVKAKEAGA